MQSGHKGRDLIRKLADILYEVPAACRPGTRSEGKVAKVDDLAPALSTFGSVERIRFIRTCRRSGQGLCK